jgi:diguanylate cyclase (GGDEF)-like protein
MADTMEIAQGVADPALQNGFTTLVENLLSVISDVAPEAEPHETAEFQSKIEQHRRRIVDARATKDLQREAEACTKTCEQYLRRSLGYHTDREAEFTEMIAILREAAGLMAGESSAFSSQVLSSTERFSALVQLDDIRVLKRQISTQVITLKRAVHDKQERDEQAYTKLNKRVEVLQTRLVKAEEEALLDPLTRIANRGSFDRSLRKLLTAAKRAGTPLALAMVDIDDFKRINDTHGHPVGDRVLLCAAMWLGKGIRHTDVLARYGGEEFALIFTDAKAAQAEARMTEVVAQISANTYDYETDGTPGKVQFTVSCGVAEFAAGDEEADLVRRADEALYDAKHKGKNRVCTKKRSLLGSLLSR